MLPQRQAERPLRGFLDPASAAMDADAVRDILNQQATMFAQALQAAQATQRPATTTPTSAAREEIRSLVDPKLLEKTPNFDGHDKEFSQWSFVFSSVAGPLGLEEAMAAAHAAPLETDVALAEMNDQSRAGRKCFGIS